MLVWIIEAPSYLYHTYLCENAKIQNMVEGTVYMTNK